jgi:hypothetical protein
MAVTRSIGESDEKRRKPYTPPVIVSREPLEAMAAICSPRPPAKANAGQCPLGPISS